MTDRSALLPTGFAFVLAALLTACPAQKTQATDAGVAASPAPSLPVATVDAGVDTVDAGVDAASATDAGSVDAGLADAGAADAGAPKAAKGGKKKPK